MQFAVEIVFVSVVMIFAKINSRCRLEHFSTQLLFYVGLLFVGAFKLIADRIAIYSILYILFWKRWMIKREENKFSKMLYENYFLFANVS